MLPFSSLDFFVLFLLIVLLVYGLKGLLAKLISFPALLMGISVLYVAFFYPKIYHITGFVIYSYAAFYLLSYRFKNMHRLAGSIIIALPLVLIKTKSFHGDLAFAGVSYMTFRTIQVYLDNELIKEKVSFKNFITFLIFTPTLLVGPIDRYQRFKADLDAGYSRLNAVNAWNGWRYILMGVLHKFIFAEMVSKYWLDPLHADSRVLSEMVNNMYAYTVFLYFDFAGYSFLAMGLGLMLGIGVPANFNKPYLAENPQDFWRRWHITLGDWLRDYFFKPIYKSLSSYKSLKNFPLMKQNIALFSTFSLMGMWNGLELRYITSGCTLGIYSVVHNSFVYNSKKKGGSFFDKMPSWLAKTISIFLMVNFACFALYLFSGRFPYLKH